MVSQTVFQLRVCGILADYADRNDHDVSRSDPIFKLLCERAVEDDVRFLASFQTNPDSQSVSRQPRS
jgi:hypothetical protein